MPPTPLWQKLMCLAIRCRHAGKAALAIEKLSQSIELTRSIPELADETITNLNYLADIYLSEGMLTEAEATVREALRREHENPNPPRSAFANNLMILAKVLHRQGRCDEAVRTGKQALAIYKKYLGRRSEYVQLTKLEIAGFKYPPTDSAPKRSEMVSRAS